MTFTLYNAALCVVCCLISAVTQLLAACVVTDNKPSWRGYGWFALLLTSHALLSTGTALKETLLIMPVSIAFAILPFIIHFRLRGWQLIFKFLIYYALLMGGETVVAIIWNAFRADEFMEAMAYYTHPICIPGQFALAAGVLSITWLYAFLRRARQNRESLMMAGRVMRIVLLLFVVIGLGCAYPALYQYQLFFDNYAELTMLYFILPALLTLGATYLMQDIRYIILYHQNRELRQQQDIQNALLHRSRMFHHNLANILCGLQGTIHRRDFDAIDEYCQDIVKRCQMINNENVQALRQIPRPAVTLLVQQKILDANEAGVPFYVHIDDNLSWRAWRDADMCQLLGVLLDNAREAAMASEAPYISLEMHNLRSGMELVVRNTWGEAQEKPQPTVDTAPSRGLGLPSVQALLRRYPRTTFSLYHRDRYVEAHMIFG
ncbi:MAG: GHKL domain-containing protein [Clostridia bacterium]|nr:GHKL domain-containing protein [Clostridia bacterium]